MSDASSDELRPTAQDVRGYLGWAAVSDFRVEEAYAAEVAAQNAACRTDRYGDDLAEALKRRVACNLARRALPLGAQMTDVGGTPIATLDSEVRRLERPYRRLMVG